MWYYCVTGGSTSQSVGKKYRVNHPKYRSTQTSFATSTCEQALLYYTIINFNNFISWNIFLKLKSL